MLPSEPVDRVVTLDQGWNETDARQYHYTSQGAVFLPLSWFESMEAGFFTRGRLLDRKRLASLGFLTDGIVADPSANPAGLPIGFASACWRRPVPSSPQDKSLGPVHCDSSTLPGEVKVGFTCAACHTSQLNYRGVGVRIEGGSSTIDFGAFQALVGKAIISTQLLPWKRGRFLKAVSRRTGLPESAVSAELDVAYGKAKALFLRSIFKPTYSTASYGRLDALQRISNTLFAGGLREPANRKRGEAPEKFPVLWDTWRLDWVQYNGSVRQPMTRNVGEAIGVGAELTLVDDAGAPNPEPGRWNSSVAVKNLYLMEEQLERLRAPVWPGSVFGPINPGLAARGRGLFDKHCSACHGIAVDDSRSPVEWKVTLVALDRIGTDPGAARQFQANRYSAEKLGLGQLGGADGLRRVASLIKDFQYDRFGLTNSQRATWDGFGRDDAVRAPLAYRARPLIGVWAAPPYLHNGSVPTLFDLLSPTRPSRFSIGGKAYDPVKVGLAAVFTGATFDTTRPGNSNAGHWFTDDGRPGRIGPRLTLIDRMALIEYLKAATYADYPCRDARSGAPIHDARCGI